MPTYTFREVSIQLDAAPMCRSCGKKRPRKLAAGQTLNPFNRNADGSLKSASEIITELKTKLAGKVRTLEAEGVICKTCKAVGQKPAATQ